MDLTPRSYIIHTFIQFGFFSCHNIWFFGFKSVSSKMTRHNLSSFILLNLMILIPCQICSAFSTQRRISLTIQINTNPFPLIYLGRYLPRSLQNLTIYLKERVRISQSTGTGTEINLKKFSMSMPKTCCA